MATRRQPLKGRELRTNWVSAVDRFEESAVLRAELGDHGWEMFAKVKRIVQDRVFAEIPMNDFEWCLRNAPDRRRLISQGR